MQTDKSYGLPDGNNIRDEWSGAILTREGWVATLWGYVNVKATLYPSQLQYSRFETIRYGRLHVRVIEKFYSARYLITLAKRFAHDVAGGQ